MHFCIWKVLLVVFFRVSPPGAAVNKVTRQATRLLYFHVQSKPPLSADASDQLTSPTETDDAPFTDEVNERLQVTAASNLFVALVPTPYTQLNESVCNKFTAPVFKATWAGV